MVELLAPAGNLNKLKTALHFGADAVYLGGKNFGLRAYSDNFSNDELTEAVAYTHARGKKLYVTLNVFARNADFAGIEAYLHFLDAAGADGVIVSDPGVLSLCRRVAPALSVHLSTQANTTNAHAAAFWAERGVKRIVLARELNLNEIAEIHGAVGDIVELEAFVHGAMCISYSGRCLLSNYLAGRDSNRGECVQACRWEYEIREKSRPDQPLTVSEDGRGTYLLNSRDLNALPILDLLVAAGVTSLKIEGRMKSEYYVSTVVNAYRRALNSMIEGKGEYKVSEELAGELYKTSHRKYTSCYLAGVNAQTECYETSKPQQEYAFIAEVKGYDAQKQLLWVEMRNRFQVGDVLEILSPGKHFNGRIAVESMYDEEGQPVADARIVQQRLAIPCAFALEEHDILRRRIEKNKTNLF